MQIYFKSNLISIPCPTVQTNPDKFQVKIKFKIHVQSQVQIQEFHPQTLWDLWNSWIIWFLLLKVQRSKNTIPALFPVVLVVREGFSKSAYSGL